MWSIVLFVCFFGPVCRRVHWSVRTRREQPKESRKGAASLISEKGISQTIASNTRAAAEEVEFEARRGESSTKLSCKHSCSTRPSSAHSTPPRSQLPTRNSQLAISGPVTLTLNPPPSLRSCAGSASSHCWRYWPSRASHWCRPNHRTTNQPPRARQLSGWPTPSLVASADGPATTTTESAPRGSQPSRSEPQLSNKCNCNASAMHAWPAAEP